jgi:peptidyl-prolyl cis-trans isomerase A (cyclophilin A)
MPAPIMFSGRTASGTTLTAFFTSVVTASLLLQAAPSLANTIVRFDTNLGSFDVELYDAVVPTTVNNFLAYVTSGRYDNTWVHRSTAIADSGFGIIQGGGYTPAETPIPTDPPIPLEYVLPNTRGTISMARTAAPNSATSQWFVNTTDNSALLGPPNNGGYAVFGEVLGNGMDVVDAINALPKATIGAFTNVPLHDYTAPEPIDLFEHGVIVESVTIVPEPSTIVLAVTAALAALLIVRRRL